MMNTFSKGFFLALLVTTTVVDATWQFTSSIEGKRDIWLLIASHGTREVGCFRFCIDSPTNIKLQHSRNTRTPDILPDANGNSQQSTGEADALNAQDGSNNVAGGVRGEEVDEKTKRNLFFGFGSSWGGGGAGRTGETTQTAPDTNSFSNTFWQNSGGSIVSYSNSAVLESLQGKGTKSPGKGMTKSPGKGMTKSPGKGKGSTSAPSLSGVPSVTPSDLPSDMPSESSAPSDSAVPSGQPSADCEDLGKIFGSVPYFVIIWSLSSNTFFLWMISFWKHQSTYYSPLNDQIPWQGNGNEHDQVPWQRKRIYFVSHSIRCSI